MPRIRTIKPEAPQHRKVGPLSDRAFRVWTVLLTQADDEGRLVCDASQVRVWAFSYHRDVDDQDVEEAIQEVARPGLIRLYSVNGTRYAVFPSWADHQKINRPSPSKLPPPPSLLDVLPVHSMTDHGALTEDSLRTHAGSDQGSGIRDQGGEGIKEGKGSEGMQGEPRGGAPTGPLRSASPPEAAPLRGPSPEADPAGEREAASKETESEANRGNQLRNVLRALKVSFPIEEQWLAYVRSKEYPETLIEVVRSELWPDGNDKAPHAKKADGTRRCQGVTRNNLECGAWALPGSNFCRLHKGQEEPA